MPVESIATRVRFGKVQVAVYWPVPHQRRKYVCRCGEQVAIFYHKGKMLPLDLQRAKENREGELVAPAHVIYCPFAYMRDEERSPNW